MCCDSFSRTCQLPSQSRKAQPYLMADGPRLGFRPAVTHPQSRASGFCTPPGPQMTRHKAACHLLLNMSFLPVQCGLGHGVGVGKGGAKELVKGGMLPSK